MTSINVTVSESPRKPQNPRVKHTDNFGGFTDEDRDLNIKAFCDNLEHKKLWERLGETEKIMPWNKSLIQSLKTYIGNTSKLTSKQKSLATSLYLDCCMTSEDKLIEQVTTRKLGYRLMELELGQRKWSGSHSTMHFIRDVMYRTDTRPFTGGQIRALQNIAQRYATKLADIELNGDFDGWFLTKTVKTNMADS
jgi:hypothetical protein